jgi:hypothetical protein
VKEFLRNNKWSLTIGFLQLILIALCFATADSEDMRLFFSSDTLYLPSIYRDLFIDGFTIEGWFLNPAPNLFPDVFLYFILNWITGDFILASILFSFVQYLLIALLIHGILKLVIPKADDFRIALIQLSIGLIYIVSITDNDFGFSFQLLSNAFHTGVFINILIALLILLSELKSPSIFKKTFLFLLIIFFGFSDKIFWIGFSLPMFCIAFLLLFSKRKIYASILLVVSIIATTISAYLLHIFENAEYITVEKPFRYLDFDNIGNSWDIMYHQLSTYVKDLRIKGLIIALTFFAVVASMINSFGAIKRYFKSTERSFGLNEYYHIFFMVFSAAVFWAPIINGNYGGWDTIRYIFAVFIFALFYLFSLIPDLRISSKKIISKIFIGLAVIGVVVLILNFKNLNQVISYYPRKINIVDQIATEQGLEYGVAGYWDAKLTTMFSKQNLKVFCTFENFNPHLHVVNRNWFFEKAHARTEAPVYEFIIIDDDKQISEAINILGPECFIVQKEDIRVLITPPFIIDRGSNKAIKITDLK